jgi:heme exporter protein B
MFLTILHSDLKAAMRSPAGILQPLLFFVITVSLFPLAISPDPEFLRQVAPGVIWICALLSTLLALDSLFKSDFDNGSLDLIAISPHPLYMMVLAKVVAHWLTTGAPLIVAAVLFGVMLNVPESVYPVLILSLLVGTPALSLIGSIGGALTVSLKRSGILLTLIIMPLYVPVVIFGAGAVNAAILNLDWVAHIYLLGAMLVLSLTLAPFAAAAALRISLN